MTGLIWHPICRVDEFVEERRVVKLGRLSVLMIKRDAVFFALENRCSHADYPLDEGHIEGDILTCPFHGAQFCILTGAHLSPPAFDDVLSLPTRQKDGILEVQVA